MGDKGIEIVFVEQKIFCTGPTRAAKAEPKSLVPARQAQRTNQGRTPYSRTLRVLIISVSTAVSRGHPSLVSLVSTYRKGYTKIQLRKGKERKYLGDRYKRDRTLITGQD
jgi:hypothetical protein